MRRVFLPLVQTGPPKLGGKAGISWPKEDGRNRAQALVNIGASATFDWGHWDEAKWRRATAAGLTFLPAQYGWENINTGSLAVAAARHPGSDWLMFNEPDINECSPRQGAVAFHKAQEAIRQANPNATVYGCGTALHPAHVEWHGAWGEQYRRLYGEYPNVRPHIHSYAADWRDRFNWPARRAELLAFREWQQGLDWFQGQVVISEWGVLTGYWWHEQQQIADYVAEALPWFNGQGWIKHHLYFTSYVPDMYRDSSVYDADSDEPTAVGDSWRGANRRGVHDASNAAGS